MTAVEARRARGNAVQLSPMFVIPAEAGNQERVDPGLRRGWTPAFAGVTSRASAGETRGKA